MSERTLRVGFGEVSICVRDIEREREWKWKTRIEILLLRNILLHWNGLKSVRVSNIAANWYLFLSLLDSIRHFCYAIKHTLFIWSTICSRSVRCHSPQGFAMCTSAGSIHFHFLTAAINHNFVCLILQKALKHLLNYSVPRNEKKSRLVFHGIIMQNNFY